jgi:hypothetical protein
MWVTRVNRVRGLFAPPPVHAGLVPRIANKDICRAVERACTAARSADSPAAPPQPRCSRSGRVLRAAPVHRSSHYNPVTSVLTPAAPCPRYLLATDGITLPIMALRCAHLPGDYDQTAKQQYQLDHCICCDMEVISVQDCITDDERRWRHIQHVLTACRRRRQFWQPIMSQLQADSHPQPDQCQHVLDLNFFSNSFTTASLPVPFIHFMNDVLPVSLTRPERTRCAAAPPVDSSAHGTYQIATVTHLLHRRVRVVPMRCILQAPLYMCTTG